MKRRKVERSNRKRVVCLRCNKELNEDNATNHQRSKHEGLTPKFKHVTEKSQQLLNFGEPSKITMENPDREDMSESLAEIDDGRYTAEAEEQPTTNPLDRIDVQLDDNRQIVTNPNIFSHSDTTKKITGESELTKSLKKQTDVTITDVEIGTETSVPKALESSAKNVDDSLMAHEETLQDLVADHGSIFNVENELETENDTTSPFEGYLQCVGQLRWSSEKLAGIVSEATDKDSIHLISSYTEMIETCDLVLERLHQAKTFALSGLEAAQNQPQEELESRERNTLIFHDPAKRPSDLARNQKKYLIQLGPCQPKLSIYPKNLTLLQKGKQSSFPNLGF